MELLCHLPVLLLSGHLLQAFLFYSIPLLLRFELEHALVCSFKSRGLGSRPQVPAFPCSRSKLGSFFLLDCDSFLELGYLILLEGRLPFSRASLQLDFLEELLLLLRQIVDSVHYLLLVLLGLRDSICGPSFRTHLLDA